MELEERTFEDYEPAVEWSHAADADTVTISFPGFKRQELRVLVDNHNHLRVRGERPIEEGSTKWIRFQTTLKLPDNCVIDGIRSKFSDETLTVKLPKTISPPDGSDPTMDDQDDNEDDDDDEEVEGQNDQGSDPTMDDQEDNEDDKDDEEEEVEVDQGTVVGEEEKPSGRPRPIRWLPVTVAAVFFVGITAYVLWRKLRSGACATGAGYGSHGELAGAGSYVSEM